MDAIVFLNQKGGAGKTTTAANVAAVLGDAGRRVLLLDLDPQAGLTKTLRVRERHNLFTNEVYTVETQLPNVRLVPGGPDLVRTEMEFTVQEKYGQLRPLLAEMGDWDYVLVDCPPNLYGLTANALVAADRIVLPFPLSPGVIYSLADTFDLIRKLGDRGYPVTSRIDGLVTIYRKVSSADKLAGVAARVIPNVLETRIRQSNYYIQAEALGMPAALLGGAKSSPRVDHRRAVAEMGLA